MTSKPIIGLKRVIRLVIWLLVLIYLAMQVSFIGNIVHRVYGQPELRVHRTVDSVTSPSSTQTWMQVRAWVSNKGHARADNVYVQVSVPGGRITRYAILSEEPYQLEEDNPSESGLAISMDRLAPGASVLVQLWAMSSRPTDVEFSAVSNEGRAAASRKPTSDEEAKAPVQFLLGGLKTSWNDLITKDPWRSIVQRLDAVVSLSTTLETVRFWHDVLLLLAISTLCWLFLSRHVGPLIVGIMAAVFSSLWFDFGIIGTVVVYTLVGVILIELVFLLHSKPQVARVCVLFVASAMLIGLVAGQGGIDNLFIRMAEMHLPLGIVVWVVITELATLLWEGDIGIV